MQKFHVVIVGGGPAGSAITQSLLKHTKCTTYLLLDDAEPNLFKIGESLPPESISVLHQIYSSIPKRLTQEVSSGRHSLCTGTACCWESSVQEERFAIMNPFGHGLHLDRAAFDEMLRETIQQESSRDQNRISVIKGKLKGLSKGEDDTWRLMVTIGDTTTHLSTHWIVDATGRKAAVATKLNIKIISSAPLLAFFAVFVCRPSLESAERDKETRTLIEAISEGWVYSVMTSRTDEEFTRVVVFHTLPSHPIAKHARRPEAFLELLDKSCSHISGIIEKYDYRIKPGYPRCTAAGSSYLSKICDASNRWLAIGDAAVAFDPLSSQGILTALQMGFYFGMKLGKQIENPEEDATEFEKRLEEMYRLVREDYERHRAYYYTIVKRFEGSEFWERVIS